MHHRQKKSQKNPKEFDNHIPTNQPARQKTKDKTQKRHREAVETTSPHPALINFNLDASRPLSSPTPTKTDHGSKHGGLPSPDMQIHAHRGALRLVFKFDPTVVGRSGDRKRKRTTRDFDGVCVCVRGWEGVRERE